MKDRSRHLSALAIVSVCLAAFGPYVAHAQDSTAETVDAVAVDASLSGVLSTPPPIPPIDVHGEIPDVSEPTIESPEEEDLTDGVNVADPGPVTPVDTGRVDAFVVESLGGELPDGVDTAGKGAQAAEQTATSNDCSADASTPVKNGMKIEGIGSATCGSRQRSLNIVVCIDYRPAGTWETLGCKPKTHSNTTTTSKKVSVPCVPGRHVYRTRVSGAAKGKSDREADIPGATRISGRLFCAS